MNLHILIHAPFETSAALLEWARMHNLNVTEIHRYRGELLPSLEEVDLLAVLGGPMSAYDPIPWIQEETAFLREAINTGKSVVGICLGSQLLASALGAEVYPGARREIGWFDLHPSTEALELFPFLSEPWTTFHWHGDTYSPPPGTYPLGRTEITSCQGFFMPPHVLALQFHPEVTADEIHGFELAEGHSLPDRGDLEVLTEGNQALFQKILTRWKDGLALPHRCHTCSDLVFPVTLENPLDGEGETREFPDQFLNLRIPHPGLLLFYRNTERRLLECPDCGRAWLYTQLPSEKKDWVKEILAPLTPQGRTGELTSVEMEARRQAADYGTTYQTNLPVILDAVNALREGNLRED